MPIDDRTPLVLGSASPRRRTLLGDLGLPLVVMAADVEEARIEGEAPTEYLERIVLMKLGAAAERARSTPHAAVVVADTIVVLGDSVLGKPRDVDEAEETLKRLAGRTHRVLTRYAVSVPPDSQRARVARTVETEVTIRAAAPAELRAYAETEEGLDKAGAYAAQGIGSFLVERISGSYTNVVGLPTCELVMDLRALGLLLAFPRKT